MRCMYTKGGLQGGGSRSLGQLHAESGRQPLRRGPARHAHPSPTLQSNNHHNHVRGTCLAHGVTPRLTTPPLYDSPKTSVT